MSTPVNLPALGESVTEGTITRWLKSVGDSVEVDEPLLEVSTDKVDTEIPSPVAGTLLEIKADEDETVEVGAELAIIGDEDEGGDSGGDDDADEGADDEEDAAADEGDDEGADEGDDEGADDEEDAAADEGDDSADDEDQSDAEEDSAEESDTSSSGSSSSGSSSKGGGGGGGGTPVTLPELGESVTEGTVTKWLKSVGDSVEVDEALLEVSTDKVDTEIPSPVAGTLLEIKVEEDETVEVGAELAIVGDGDADAGGGDTEADQDDDEDQDAESSESSESSEPEGDDQDDEGDEGDDDSAEEDAESDEPEPEPEPEKDEPEPKAEAEEKPEPEKKESASSDSRGYVTPLVRKLAAEHDVDLESLEGTGVGGRIRKQDVLDAAKSKQQPEQKDEKAPAASGSAGGGSAGSTPDPSPLRGKTEKMSRLRKTIAKRMVESLQVSAQLTTVVEVDVTAIARLRQSVKDDFAAREGVKLSFMPFFAKATIDTLKAHPSLNAALDTEKGEITFFDHENLAIAVDTERGLLTPVIKNAGDLNVAGLTRHIADLAERTRAGKIGPDELSGGTFTLTNTGSRGALFDTPIINQPQVAILGTGTVVKRPVVLDDPNLGETIAVRQMCYFSLTYDHRLVDGADAARFLSDLKERVESGSFEV